MRLRIWLVMTLLTQPVSHAPKVIRRRWVCDKSLIDVRRHRVRWLSQYPIKAWAEQQVRGTTVSNVDETEKTISRALQVLGVPSFPSSSSNPRWQGRAGLIACATISGPRASGVSASGHTGIPALDESAARRRTIPESFLLRRRCDCRNEFSFPGLAQMRGDTMSAVLPLFV